VEEKSKRQPNNRIQDIWLCQYKKCHYEKSSVPSKNQRCIHSLSLRKKSTLCKQVGKTLSCQLEDRSKIFRREGHQWVKEYSWRSRYKNNTSPSLFRVSRGTDHCYDYGSQITHTSALELNIESEPFGRFNIKNTKDHAFRRTCLG